MKSKRCKNGMCVFVSNPNMQSKIFGTPAQRTGVPEIKPLSSAARARNSFVRCVNGRLNFKSVVRRADNMDNFYF